MKRLLLFLLLAAQLSIPNSTFPISQARAQDRGFIHPGGLHTQADFDRVRAQIAAGNTKVTQAFAKLKAAAYAQSSVQTYPVETIVRGGGSGENYINACRGATMAYQNALRWKIEDNKGCANAAVRILMAWANTTKAIGGDSNYALAAGLYGYQFAQAAELMRDYDGWSRDDFATFQRWMLDVWYPASIGFLRARNGTWDNADKWWDAPGHYWSNWGLCNALCVAMIGILCDDVFIYNQGMSYFKYDQVGNFTNPPTQHTVENHDYTGTAIFNDGLTEFLGNLVVTHVESELETGAYGRLGQMNESGRDTGHSAMALGLAIDLAKVGWNQGDDLFAYMDHRLAAGIEYVAAQTQSVADLPWTPYLYGSNGYYYTDYRTWLMTGPALGAQMRPYWGTVIGIYEGVKGVRMPFAEVSYQNMGIDEGGQGGTSGGYDHLGYSILMNTRDEQLCPAELTPTELTPKMEYSGTLNGNLVPSITKERARGLIDGKVLYHNELGGLVNTYTVNTSTTLPPGQTLTLMPQLPADEEDTGRWQWNTGENTRDITVTTDRSFIYRVTYTNARGIPSTLAFPIAARGDCTPDRLTPSATTPISILYGKTATLAVTPSAGWGTYKWSTGATTQSITTPAIRKDQDITVTFTNQGGATTTLTFPIRMMAAVPYVTIGETTTETNEVVIDDGATVTLGLTTPTTVTAAKVTWSALATDATAKTLATGKTLTLADLHTSGTYTATFTLAGEEYTFTFHVLVKDATAATVAPGNYLIQHVATGRLLTAHGKSQAVTFEPAGGSTAEGTSEESDTEGTSEGSTAEGSSEGSDASSGQVWFITANPTATNTRYALVTLPDSLTLSSTTKTITTRTYLFTFDRAVGSDRYALHTGTTASTTKYWTLDADGTLQTTEKTLTAYPFRLIPVPATAIAPITFGPNPYDPSADPSSPSSSSSPTLFYTLDGLRHSRPQRGITIIRHTFPDGTPQTRKILR